jgi:hypothetical protein
VSDEPAAIIHRPPSSQIGSTLLVASTIGLIACIAIVWTELFTEYLPSTGKPGSPPPDPLMQFADSKTIATQHRRDHYGSDFKEGANLLEAVEKELTVSSKIGDLNPSLNVSTPEPEAPSGPPAATDAPPPAATEAPPEGATEGGEGG